MHSLNWSFLNWCWHFLEVWNSHKYIRCLLNCVGPSLLLYTDGTWADNGFLYPWRLQNNSHLSHYLFCLTRTQNTALSKNDMWKKPVCEASVWVCFQNYQKFAETALQFLKLGLLWWQDILYGEKIIQI